MWGARPLVFWVFAAANKSRLVICLVQLWKKTANLWPGGSTQRVCLENMASGTGFGSRGSGKTDPDSRIDLDIFSSCIASKDRMAKKGGRKRTFRREEFQATSCVILFLFTLIKLDNLTVHSNHPPERNLHGHFDPHPSLMST